MKDGSFLDRRENLLVFGKPGSGKTHCVCALAVDRAISQLDFGKGALLDVDALAVHLVASTAAPPM